MSEYINHIRMKHVCLLFVSYTLYRVNMEFRSIFSRVMILDVIRKERIKLFCILILINVDIIMIPDNYFLF